MRPVLLDLFCKAGGAGMGYHLAGFDVVGVDVEPQPNYPFEFHQADAMAFPLAGFDAVHASPPCQHYANVTTCRGADRNAYPDLVDPVRSRLAASGLPYVIENVANSPLRSALMLCGSMFGLRVRRHRYFEVSPQPAAWAPAPCDHRGLLPFCHAAERAYADALGCDWMTGREGRAAVPPAYTRHLGALLLPPARAAA